MVASMTAANEKSEAQLTEEACVRLLGNGIKSRVWRLRDLADSIEREANVNLERAKAGNGIYASVASSFVHTMAWGVANLNLETLIATAADADIAHAEHVAEEKGRQGGSEK